MHRRAIQQLIKKKNKEQNWVVPNNKGSREWGCVNVSPASATSCGATQQQQDEEDGVGLRSSNRTTPTVAKQQLPSKEC